MTATATAVPSPVLLEERTAIKDHPRVPGRTFALEMVTERIYDNGTRIFLCRHDGCDYTATTVNSIFGHLGSHSPLRVEKIKAGHRRKREQTTLTRDDLHAALDRYLDQMSADAQVTLLTQRMESWKERAVVAERKLRDVEKATRILAINFGDKDK